MPRTLLIACTLLLAALALASRLHRLGTPPLHFDEAVHAWRFAQQRLGNGTYQFDPAHYHGPALGLSQLCAARLRGESAWPELTAPTLRLGPAFAGAATVLLPLLLRRRLGTGGAFLAALLILFSPLLGYFQRQAIHEPLLVCFTLAALAALDRVLLRPGPIPALAFGLALGLMWATKATAALTAASWAAAGLCSLAAARPSRETLTKYWREYRRPLLRAAAAAFLTGALLYTDFFRHPAALVDSVRTYWTYATDPGHEKPLDYYARLLLLPQYRGGFWWAGTGPALLALLGAALAFRAPSARLPSAAWARWLSVALALQLLAYHAFAYKMPWLMCVPWLHALLLAGFAAHAVFSSLPRARLPFLALVLAVLAFSTVEFRRACFRFPNDARNPFAYSPTSGDVRDLETLLQQVAAASPGLSGRPVAVIGPHYWPLPWYLRAFPQVGYFPSCPPDLSPFPIVLAMPDQAGDAAARLGDSCFSFPRGLRNNLPVIVFIEQSAWNRTFGASP